jgi:Putative peptidoglycan binding domain
MALSVGSAGQTVRELQEGLNLLMPTKLPLLATDGRFGSKTQARVKEFQRSKGLVDDGIVGSLTMAAFEQALRLLGLLPGPPTPANQSVRSINQTILGVNGPGNLIPQIIPSIEVIAESTFRAGVPTNAPSFRSVAPTTGRLGIFAAKKGDLERAVILLLPASGTPDRVMICISQGFGQAIDTVGKLGFNNPLSPALINFVLLKHVINRWGAQTLASRKQMAFLYIVRSEGKGKSELGPFANDGAFVKQTLTELVSLTSNAFTFDTVEAFTFSSGILDFNPFLTSIGGQLNVKAVYSLDPNPRNPARQPAGAVRKQFSRSPVLAAGFESMPLNRWQNESSFAIRQTFAKNGQGFEFQYLHNHCVPKYLLHLGVQTS